MPTRSFAPVPFLVRRPLGPAFVGRARELELLHAVLQGEERAIGVCGRSGIGKTALAFAYTNRYQHAYPGGVYWVDAPSGCDEGFAALATAIGLRAEGPLSDRRRQLVQAFAKHLRLRPDALLVIDGVPAPSALSARVLGFVPAELACRLLFTMRAPPGNLVLPTFDLGPLAEEARVELLLSGLEMPDAEEMEAARRVCGALARNPLLVSIAAGWLARRPGRSAGDLARRLAGAEVAAARAAVLKLGWDDVPEGEARRLLALLSMGKGEALVPATRLAWLEGRRAGEPIQAAVRALAATNLVDVDKAGQARLWPDVRAFVEGALDPVFRDELRVQAAAHLERALGDVGSIERDVAERGIAAVLADVRASSAWAAGARGVASMRGALELEANALVGWDASREPAFFLQQLRARAEAFEGANFTEALDGALAARHSPWIRVRSRTSRRGEVSARVLEGHAAKVNAVAITRDGRLALSASDDRTVRVWDLEAGQALFVLTGHVSAVRGVVVSADGRTAASGAADGSLFVWDLATARVTRHLRGHTGVVHAVALAEDAGTVVSASEDGTVCVWSLSTGELVRTLHGHVGGVHGVAITADGRSCVSAGEDDEALWLWDVDAGRVENAPDAPGSPRSAVAMKAEGRVLVAASHEDAVLCWAPLEGSPPELLAGHTDGVTSVAMTPDGRFLASGSWDHTVRMWDLDARIPLGVLHGHAEGVQAVALTPDGRTVVSGGEDRTVRVWDLGTNVAPGVPGGHHARVSALAATPDGSFVVSASFDDTLRIWDARQGALHAVLEGHALWVHGVAVTPDGKRVISASVDGSLRVWDVATGQLAWVISYLPGRGPGTMSLGREGVPLCAPLLVDERGTRVITKSQEGALAAWDLTEGQRVRTYGTGREEPLCGALVGNRLAAGGADGQVVLWDVGSAAQVSELVGHEAAVRAVGMSADGGFLVSASEDHTIRVWDLGAGRVVRVLAGHRAPVGALAWLGDARHLVSASEDRTIRVWDLATGGSVARLVVREPVEALAAGPGARSIVAGDRAGHVSFLELEGTD
ncbi:AAA family ATPase [Polyangium mundeleinium]|uniref:AAA family ATPase n=1 Tax=Polyangium mundeleinium TaxID=2995306 RepID=A0ABT5ENV0_9BACT|nr:AAA family ATPase [Polyangium mundeleinium]MDC0743518.1 AAA family ATPase [Polyangium mundeleinium]